MLNSTNSTISTSNRSAATLIDPMTFWKEFFDSDIAPNLLAPTSVEVTLKCCVYRKLFLDICSRELVARSPVTFNDYYLIADTSLQTIGLLCT